MAVVQNIPCPTGPAFAHCRSQRYVSRENTAAKYRRRQTALWPMVYFVQLLFGTESFAIA